MSYQHQILGTIIASVLDYDHLCSITGDNVVINNSKSSYVPCDGRSIVGSQLTAKSHLQSAPDMRGRFMRGLNEIYSVGQPLLDKNTADPDGDNRQVGQYQRDAFKMHNHGGGGHTHTVTTQQDDGGGQIGHPDDSNKGFIHDNGGDCLFHNFVNNSGSIINNDGESESRPRNISVYYYIKIN